VLAPVRKRGDLPVRERGLRAYFQEADSFKEGAVAHEDDQVNRVEVATTLRSPM
jgi:hypothetical protein